MFDFCSTKTGGVEGEKGVEGQKLCLGWFPFGFWLFISLSDIGLNFMILCWGRGGCPWYFEKVEFAFLSLRNCCFGGCLPAEEMGWWMCCIVSLTMPFGIVFDIGKRNLLSSKMCREWQPKTWKSQLVQKKRYPPCMLGLAHAWTKNDGGGCWGCWGWVFKISKVVKLSFQTPLHLSGWKVETFPPFF